jgi:hypothetical protein
VNARAEEKSEHQAERRDAKTNYHPAALSFLHGHPPVQLHSIVRMLEMEDSYCEPRQAHRNWLALASRFDFDLYQWLCHTVDPTNLGKRKFGDAMNDEKLEKKQNPMKSDTKQEKAASQLITERIAELGDWRGDMLAHVRELIKETEPGIIEEWKWRGVPVWSHNGLVCTGESYKAIIKLTFAKGASIDDPKGLFNSSLEGNTRRAIDLHEGDKLNEKAFKDLIRFAVKLNSAKKKT